MRHRLIDLSLIPLIMLAALLIFPAGTLAGTSAKPTFRHEEWNDPPVSVTDFCDVPGLTAEVQSSGHVDIQIRFNKGVYAIFSDHLVFTDTWTGPNGAQVIVTANRHGHDSRVVDNGDGTYTDYWTETGAPFVVVGPNGERSMDTGRIVWKFIYADSGTPGNPDDDVFLSFEGIVDVAGPHPAATEDVFCPIAVPAFTS